ncbi:hypothetical protein [Actinoplanes sp. TFC3]|uniref:hypothetical protein n=1 Tax=Actinoplanes sp. TFC3 TaxID=1710355 RepID=UPI0008300BB5|nr:hypothetical protein [Actinoplanes sp. TFC3]
MKIFGLVLAALLSVMALVTGIAGRDDPQLQSQGRDLTDAVVVAYEVTGGKDTVLLRVSDPQREVQCRVERSAFAGDWPQAGEVVPVMSAGAGSCDLPVLTGRLPRTQLLTTGLIGTALLSGYAVVRLRRARCRRAQDATLVRHLAQAGVRWTGTLTASRSRKVTGYE